MQSAVVSCSNATTNPFKHDIDTLRGVGPQLKQRFALIGIRSIQDLLLYFPIKYQDRTRITAIADCTVGEQVQVFGEIKTQQIVYQGKRVLQILLQDHSGCLVIRFFHFYASQLPGLKPGSHLLCFGSIRQGKDSLEMIHPNYQQYDSNQAPPLPQGLTPIYLQKENLSANRIRKLIEQAFERIAEMDRKVFDTEILPPPIMNKYQFPSWLDSLNNLHFPACHESLKLLQQQKHPAQIRLAFEELLSHQLILLRSRMRIKKLHAPQIKPSRLLTNQLTKNLSFKLTTAQQRVLSEIRQDLGKAQPMLRLLQGDVGSGKTVVAGFALAWVIAQNYQCALMAPTEVLANQHFLNLQAWLQPIGISPMFLSGQLSSKLKQQRLQALAKGDVKLIVGTHALFQDKVKFKRLGLLIIDEQQRFGVKQRQALVAKGRQQNQMPHLLSMTATPIPRSLAMTAYADFDCSILDELPPGRKPVATLVMPETRREQVIQRIMHILAKGHQVFWVCPLIEQSETLQCQAAEHTKDMLSQCLATANIDLIHGRMRSEDKEKALNKFKQGHTQILVATTVIEVGVDIPNANLMIIENAERLGLAQLHQLRGRVGRGSAQSTCLMLYKSPLTDIAKKRLALLRHCHDGFRIAEADLKLRGPGELLGARQTGELGLQIADLTIHQYLLADVKRVAKSMLQTPEQAKIIRQRWLNDKQQFMRV